MEVKTMGDRQVTSTGKDSQGDITKLCGSWGECSKADAISDIDSGTNTYFVQESGTTRVDIIVVNDNPRYLRSTPDPESSNNLDNLPDC
jgi:hypothetical protein